MRLILSYILSEAELKFFDTFLTVGIFFFTFSQSKFKPKPNTKFLDIGWFLFKKPISKYIGPELSVVETKLNWTQFVL